MAASRKGPVPSFMLPDEIEPAAPPAQSDADKMKKFEVGPGPIAVRFSRRVAVHSVGLPSASLLLNLLCSADLWLTRVVAVVFVRLCEPRA